MVTLTNTPSNIGHLNPSAYKFNIRLIPNTTFFVQAVNLPALSYTPGLMATPFANINLVGGTMEYEDLTVTFIVDEDLANWLEIFNWMSAITAPKNFGQYKNRKESNDNLRIDQGDLITSAELIVLTNTKNPNIQVMFDDVFPINLSEIQFDITHTENTTVTATAVFKYTTYRVETVNTVAAAASATT